MIEGFQSADYVLAALALAMAMMGLFRGFSGSLAFVLAVAAALFTATTVWYYSENFTAEMWMRGAGTLVTTLLAFGMVRWLVKKLVNGLLAQPSDALFGFVTGAVFAGLITLAWAWSGIYTEYSTLVTALVPYVR